MHEHRICSVLGAMRQNGEKDLLKLLKKVYNGAGLRIMARLQKGSLP
jgi:hypothetical protein